MAKKEEMSKEELFSILDKKKSDKKEVKKENKYFFVKLILKNEEVPLHRTLF